MSSTNVNPGDQGADDRPFANPSRRRRSDERTDERTEHEEGTVARTIEQQTAKIPSDAFLWVAVGSMAASLILQLAGKEDKATFVGQWAPTLLILGLYNKMVKLHGSDPA